MSFPMLDLIEQVVINTFGNMTTFALIAIALLLIAFLFAGIDFRIAALLVMPVLMGFAAISWVWKGVEGLGWIIFVGFALFLMWNWIRER